MGSFVMSSKVIRGRQSNQEIQYFPETLAGLIAYKASAPVSSDVPTPDDLLRAGLLPSDTVVNSQWVSAEGQPIVLGSDKGAWVLSYENMSPSFCEAFVPEVVMYPQWVSSVMINDQALSVDSVLPLKLACQGERKTVRFVLKDNSQAGPLSPVVTAPLDAKDKRWDTQETM